MRLTVSLLAALFVLALGAVPASAGFTAPHPFVSSFDGSGSTAGTFSNIDSVAVSRSSGNVFVYDRGSSSLSQFDSSGAPVAFSDPGLFGASSITLAFAGTSGDVAVDSSGTASDGNVYVTVPQGFFGPSTVYGFDASGASLPGFPKSLEGQVCGLGVDPAGHLWVSRFGNGVREYDSLGNALGGFLDGGFICNGVAFDAAGSLYVGTSAQVEKYNPDGSGGFVADPDLPVLDAASPEAVATDTRSGHIFVAHSSSTTAAVLW